MRPKQETQAKRLRNSSARDGPQLAFHHDTIDPGGLEVDSSSKEKGAMEAISEDEDERIMDLEAEVEELREQVRTIPVLDMLRPCMAPGIPALIDSGRREEHVSGVCL